MRVCGSLFHLVAVSTACQASYFWSGFLECQEKGFVNHLEQHPFLLLDVKISSTSLEAIVFAVPEQEFQAWIFF